MPAVPALGRRFVAYGARAPPQAARPGRRRGKAETVLARLLDSAAGLRLPHRYFAHFYLVSVASSAFWAWRLALWRAGAQLRLVWALMLLQGVRRLLETCAYPASTTSSMWFAHWLMGLLFYAVTNVAVWVELACSREPAATRHDALAWKAALLVPPLLAAHLLQHSYHAYLYRLRAQHADYQLPSHPLFPSLLCPHYTCEVAIYGLLSLLAAPSGMLVNWTLACATVFVAANLGVTAAGTKHWYAAKFGAAAVRGRKRMVPWLW